MDEKNCGIILMKGEIFDSIDSTHQYVKQKILKGEIREPYYTFAFSQEAGIGTHGRAWSSPSGESFSLSVAFPETQIQSPVSTLTIFFAYCLKQFLKQQESIESQLKWSNDVYIQDKKAAGVLIEKLPGFFLVGIGLNVNQSIFSEDLKEIAISLFQADGKSRDVKDLLFRFLAFLEEEWKRLQENPLYFWESLNMGWLYQNELVSITDDEAQTVVEGIFHKVLTDGSLILNKDGNPLKISRGTLRKK